MLKSPTIRQFWIDETGTVTAIGYLVLVTLLGIGMIVGLDTFRIALIQEYGDVGAALENLNQNYTVTLNYPDGSTVVLEYSGDTADNAATSPDNPADTAGAPPPGITITPPAFEEGQGAATFDAGGLDEEGDPLPTFP